jgi:radical SAM protein with 4Fe4S-binding SPASM domain
LIERLLKENHPKAWFRAFFNLGLINYIEDQPRMLPCEAGSANFFIEPNGEVYPCNGLEERYWKESMGNIRDVQSFEELWFSERADAVRAKVRTCPKNCWMVGTAAPVMKKYIRHPAMWVAKNKLKSLLGKPICTDTVPVCNVGQDSRQGDLRGGDSVATKYKIEVRERQKPIGETERLKLIEEIELENI